MWEGKNPRALSGFSTSFSILKFGPNIFLNLYSSSGVIVSNPYFSSSTLISYSLTDSFSISWFSKILLNFLFGSNVMITGAFSRQLCRFFSYSEQLEPSSLETSSMLMPSVLLSLFSEPWQLATFSPSMTSLQLSSGFLFVERFPGWADWGFGLLTFRRSWISWS